MRAERLADHAMHEEFLEVTAETASQINRARAEGRSAHRFFEPAMDASIRERDQIEMALRAAIAAGIT